jgi:hypothetical protein
MLDKLNYLAVRNFPFALVLQKGQRKQAIEKIVSALEYFWVEELRYLEKNQTNQVIFDQDRNEWDIAIKINLIRQKCGDVNFFDQSVRLSLLFVLFREHYDYLDVLEIFGFSAQDFQTHYLAAWDELAESQNLKLWQSADQEKLPDYCHHSRAVINRHFLRMVKGCPSVEEFHLEGCLYCQDQSKKVLSKTDYLIGKLPGRLEIFSEREKNHLKLILNKAMQLSPSANQPKNLLGKIGLMKDQFFSNF